MLGELPNKERFRLDNEERVIQLHNHLFGMVALPKYVWKRPCYADFAKRVVEHFTTKSGEVLIAGTRGIGKSAFGMMMVFQFVDDGKVVLYENKGERMMVVGEKANDARQLGDLGLCFGHYSYELVLEQGVYEFDDPHDSALYNSLLRSISMIHIQDLGDSPSGSITKSGNARKLIISSPNSHRLSGLHSNVGMLTLFMDRWTFEEIQQLHVTAFRNAGISDDQLREAFDVFGGIPRLLFDQDERKRNALLWKQINELNMEDMVHIFRTPEFINLPRQLRTDTLIHVVPADGDIEDFKRVFASEYISRRLAERFVEDRSYMAQAFTACVSHVKEFGSWRGYMLEAMAHKKLPAGVTVQFRKLNEKETKACAFESVTLPRMQGTLIFRTKLDELEGVKEMVYMRPKSKTYPTIDSAVVLEDGSVLDSTLPKARCLVVFQVTVSATHKVNGAEIKRFQDAVADKLTTGATGEKAKLPTILVFVTKRDGIQFHQSITASTGDEYKPGNAPDVSEYALLLGPEFEELAKLWKDE